MSQRKRSKGLGCSQMTDGEDDFIPTQVERHSQDEVNQKVSELVQFLLVKDQKKIPIKRADVLKNIIREYRNAYSEIVRRADRTLQEVFGLQLVEIDTKRHIYILINNLPRAEGQHLCRGKEKEKMALLLVILSFIFMKGNSVKDSALWEFLHLLRVHPGKQHGVFGDVRKLVTEEFVRQKYLEITPIPLTDPPEFKYQWGPRAEKETSKKDVLNFVAKMQGKDPTFWASQYSEAEADNTTT
ncbi:non-structural maintenance of chromosomes element 3 homolog isoform X1 [Haemorhous mexicanus]|uniref:non-structural maintenance of chromosomes element 3 homolog isoform X1 n=1 Tax=Haemorhous mexicanus TaxID=30427 RepID=UPI0028BDFEFC|nr:non-structural maintenance of chromosomes element 3 homolog isoform X1 [Haemorhous mexicanus]XP_059693412.1 non-structural maintenance of chromosomes element 3 homolog isoform X1 [Haemorhous mexicanus]